MSEEAKNSGKGRALGSAAAGTALGALVMAFLQDYPAVVQQFVAWGPGLVILLIVAGFLHAHVPPFIQSQQQIARNLGELSHSIGERFRAEDDVRMACRALSGDVERMREFMEARFDALSALLREPKA